MSSPKQSNRLGKPESSLRHKLHTIIFEADTPAGRAFDITLLVAILFSVGAAILESVEYLNNTLRLGIYYLEWGLTILFTVEYCLRIFSVRRPLLYIFSFYGIIDLLSILPTYLSLFFTGSQSLIVIRSLRLLRVFRILKLSRYLIESNELLDAMRRSRPKIIVFMGTMLTIAVIMGTLMYLVEGEENGFTSIPRSIYWAIVTMTTVGYGDIAPRTVPGQILAATLMVLGYAIIAVPTGIVSAQLVRGPDQPVSTQACPSCGKDGHDFDAEFCKYCGASMKEEATEG